MVESQFGLPERSLEQLKDRAASFAGSIAVFCKKMGIHTLESLIAVHQVSLPSGSAEDIISSRTSGEVFHPEIGARGTPWLALP